MKYLDKIETYLGDTPVTIGVINFTRHPGSRNYNAESDVDYYGWVEYDYDLLDENDNPVKMDLDNKQIDRIHDIICGVYQQ